MNQLVAIVRAEQRRHWESGYHLLIEHFLEQFPELLQDEESTLELIYSEKKLREEFGEQVQPDEYLQRFPHLTQQLQQQFSVDTKPGTSGTLSELAQPTVVASLVGAENRPTLPALPYREPKLPAIPGYEILDELGRGTFGVVYKVRQLSLDRVLALKMMRPGMDEWLAQGAALFRREAETVAKIRHPHIVELYDFGEHAERLYYTMEFVDGGTLETKLRDGPLPPREAATLVEKLALAMQRAHEAEVVHRDLKPTNVLLTRDGTPKVADFGLAKRLDAEASLLAGMALIGTPNYMAPEQTIGKNRTVGKPADVWALGVILYQTVTGKLPFAAKDMEQIFAKIRHAEPVSPRSRRPDLPRDLETICLNCLEKEPARRYASAALVAERLRSFLDGKRIPERPRRWPGRMWRFVRTHRFSSAMVVLIVAVLACSLIAAYYHPARIEPKTALQKTGKYEFVGTEPFPRSFRWVVGDPGNLVSNKKDKCLTCQTMTTSLLELVDEMPFDHYRFSAELRHDDNSNGSYLGLYCLYREKVNSEGVPFRAFGTFTFADRYNSALVTHENDIDQSRAVFTCRGVGADSGQVRGKMWVRPILFTPALPLKKPAPWRKLELEVSPQGVICRWVHDSGETEETQLIRADQYQVNLAGLKHLFVGFNDLPEDFSAKRGLGFIVFRGKASVRNIVVQRVLESN